MEGRALYRLQDPWQASEGRILEPTNWVAPKDKVTLFSSSYSHLFVNYPKVTGLFTEETIDGINYIWVKSSKYKGSKSIGRVLSMLMFMLKLFLFNFFKRERPDVIIVSSLSLFPILNI